MLPPPIAPIRLAIHTLYDELHGRHQLAPDDDVQEHTMILRTPPQRHHVMPGSFPRSPRLHHPSSPPEMMRIYDEITCIYDYPYQPRNLFSVTSDSSTCQSAQSLPWGSPIEEATPRQGSDLTLLDVDDPENLDLVTAMTALFRELVGNEDDGQLHTPTPSALAGQESRGTSFYFKLPRRPPSPSRPFTNPPPTRPTPSSPHILPPFLTLPTFLPCSSPTTPTTWSIPMVQCLSQTPLPFLRNSLHSSSRPLSLPFNLPTPPQRLPERMPNLASFTPICQKTRELAAWLPSME